MNILKQTAAEWATGNPVLADKQQGIDTTNNIFKIGNGQTRWLDLKIEDYIEMSQPVTLVTGTNPINLSNIAGQEYNAYDMASGALTLTIAASPVRGGCAYGIIIADGSTAPVVSAFTVLSGEYTNTNDVQNHFFISYKYNGSGVLTGYLQWLQPV
jgi:hypothetical protein